MSLLRNAVLCDINPHCDKAGHNGPVGSTNHISPFHVGFWPTLERLFGVEHDEARDVIGGIDVADLRVIAQSVVGQLFADGDEPALADVIVEFI